MFLHDYKMASTSWVLQFTETKKITRSLVIEEGIDDQRDADLMDMTKFSKFNDG